MTERVKCHYGVWLPAEEEHLVGMMSPGAKRFAQLPDGRASYQRHKYLEARDLVPAERRAVFVDVGAHVGLWSMQAALDFERIIAFEPHPLHRTLFRRNLGKPEGCTVNCIGVALGAAPGSVALSGMAGSSGDTHVSGPGDIAMATLDSFDIERIDLMKIDTEGFELPICRGAVATLTRCKPVVVVEQKGRDALYHGGSSGEALEFLLGLGMVELRPAMSGDFFMGWPR